MPIETRSTSQSQPQRLPTDQASAFFPAPFSQKEIENFISKAVKKAVDDAIRSTTEFFNEKLTAIREVVEKQCETIGFLEHKVKTLEKETKHLEQYSRRSHLRINGMKVVRGEGHAVDYKQQVSNFVSHNLRDKGGVPISLNPEDIDAAHPLPTKNPGDIPTINVRFHAREQRDKVIAARRRLKETWKEINNILNRNRQKNTQIEYITHNNTKIDTSQQIADELNTYFTQIGHQIASNIPTTAYDIHEYLTPNTAPPVEFTNVQPTDIDLIIRRLKSKFSTGHDDISSSLIKSLRTELINPLTLRFPFELKTPQRADALISSLSQLDLTYSVFYSFAAKYMITRSKSRRSEKDSSDMDLSSFVGALTSALQDTQVRACLSDDVGESFRQELISLKAELKKKDSVIEHLDRRIESLESQNDALEQYTRRNSIRVTGLPEVEHEDILDRTLKIVNEDLEVNPPISIMDIDSASGRQKEP
ncbi:hypothetical protein CAPTEDRAFT_188214 [Capitella teleta]|uniref:Uncharacterized protein n=1 Tax=Capitella teleta TaxID=283909 RepID=R7T8T0_CAPTE|nr:hypothetical protein CAPTEDRAFT_188214 [Capitella teleta]|eukprot:ELT89823.1 hypothetical protein CAPTEDRAFT_188214 [Capitella teleta]